LRLFPRRLSVNGNVISCFFIQGSIQDIKVVEYDFAYPKANGKSSRQIGSAQKLLDFSRGKLTRKIGQVEEKQGDNRILEESIRSEQGALKDQKGVIFGWLASASQKGMGEVWSGGKKRKRSNVSKMGSNASEEVVLSRRKGKSFSTRF
jgi:hypothetical protein